MYAESKYNAQYGTWITKGSPFLEEPAAEVRSYSVGEYINRARDIPDPDNYEDCRYYDYDDYEPAQPSDEEIETSLNEYKSVIPLNLVKKIVKAGTVYHPA